MVTSTIFHLDKLPVGRLCQVVGHQKIRRQEVENFQAGEDHGEFVDDDDGLERDEAEPGQQREHVSGEEPDLLGLHDAGAERAHHQLPWKHRRHSSSESS